MQQQPVTVREVTSHKLKVSPLIAGKCYMMNWYKTNRVPTTKIERNVGKKSVFYVYTVVVVGLTIISSRLYHNWENTPVRDDDIFNGRSWVGSCVKTERSENIYQLQCSSLKTCAKADDYNRAVLAWEQTGELRPSNQSSK